VSGLILSFTWCALYVAATAACFLPPSFGLPSSCGPFAFADLPGIALSRPFEDLITHTIPVRDFRFLFYSRFVTSALVWSLVGGIAGFLVRRRALAVVAAALLTALTLAAFFAVILSSLGWRVG
jgi:hypothetical protein